VLPILRLDDRVTQYLLGSSEVDARLAGIARCIDPQVGVEDLILSRMEKEGLSRLAVKAKHETTIFYLHGPYGVGKRSTAEALAHAAGKRLLIVDGQRVAAAELATAELHVALAMREARLQQAEPQAQTKADSSALQRQPEAEKAKEEEEKHKVHARLEPGAVARQAEDEEKPS
jgi:SpoVK/Ycf46/Vps4 family AAA+-type ATPase